jgi:hypothetical protein
MRRAVYNDQELLALAAKETKPTSWVRREYSKHRSVVNAIDGALQRNGTPLSERAQQLWEGRRGALQLAIAQMNDQVDRVLLERRNEFRFGARVAPSLEWLLASAKNQFNSETEQYQTVIDWAVRPDLYSYRRREFSGVEFRRLKLIRKAIPSLLKKKVSFVETGDPEHPLRAVVTSKEWSVLVNGFPEEPLYTLTIDGVEAMDFDDWPANWSRPSAEGA